MKKSILLFFMAFGLLAFGQSCSDEKIAVRQGAEDNELTLKHNPGMNLVGRVTVDGQPRQGVAVSDGVSVVLTDANGEYQMRSSALSEYVYVSTPADCQLPVENGMPYFYRKIDFSDSHIIQRDFKLSSKAVDDSFKLLAITDVQIGTEHDDELCQPLMDSIANYTNSRKDIVLGLNMGDIVWNKPAQYANYKQYIKKINVPVLNVIGNHDHNEKVANDSLSVQEYRDALGPTYYSYNIGQWHVVILDDVIKNGAQRNDYVSGINATQLTWLKQDLANVDKSKSILIGLHIPTSRRNNPNNHLSNRQALYDLVKDFHRTVILSGHTHNNFTTDIAPNIREYTLGSVMGAYWNEYNGVGICNDGSPRGFAVLSFKGNELTDEYYKGEEHPQSYQIKIYPPAEASFRWGRVSGTIAAPADAVPLRVDNSTVLINVFNWNTDWTVTLSEDGGQPLQLTQNVTCLDPEAVKTLQGDNTWEYRPTAEPEEHNDHNFLYTPKSKDWKTITVTATDAFGNKYTATLNK